MKEKINNDVDLSIAELAFIIEQLQDQLQNEFDHREKDLKHLKLVQDEYLKLERKYNSLSRSKLGKIQLYYWKLRKRLKGINEFMLNLVDIDARLKNLNKSKKEFKDKIPFNSQQLETLQNDLVKLSIKKFKITDWFVNANNNINVYKKGKSIITKLEDNKQCYLSYLEKNLTFTKLPKKSHISVKNDKKYHFLFDASKEGNGFVELILITYNAYQKEKVYSIPIGEKKSLVFDKDIKNLRIALKITGGAKIQFNEIKIIEQSILKVSNQLEERNKLDSFVQYVDRVKSIENYIPKKQIKIASILDKFSYDSFKYEANLIPLSCDNWKEEITTEQPQLLFVESAWYGNNGEWKYQIARINERKRKSKLIDLINYCKMLSIPTVFWDKEGSINFDNFKDISIYFDYIFVTDENNIPKYKEIVQHSNIYPLSFAAQPRTHNPVNRNRHYLGKVAFAGSWYGDKHQERLKDVGNIVKPALNYNLDIYDRQFDKENPKYKWPSEYSEYILGKLDYRYMIECYKNYDIFLNVNSIQDSEYMFSRRVYELLASRTMVLSGNSIGLKKQLGDYLYISNSEKETETTLKLLQNSPLKRDREAKKAQRFVYDNHTYSHRVEEILSKVGISFIQDEKKGVTAIISTNRPDYIKNIYGTIKRQTYEKVEYIIVLNHKDMNIKDWECKFNEFNNVNIIQIDESKNLTYCLNRAIEKANYDIIAKIDDDDYYAENYLTDMVQAFDYTDAAIIGKGEYFVYLDHLNILGKRRIGKNSSEERYTNLVSGATLVFKKEVAEKINGFNEELVRGGDTEFLKRATSAGYRIYSNDVYNFVLIRRNDKSSHTWQLDDRGILEKTSIISYTKDYKTHVSV